MTPKIRIIKTHKISICLSDFEIMYSSCFKKPCFRISQKLAIMKNENNGEDAITLMEIKQRNEKNWDVVGCGDLTKQQPFYFSMYRTMLENVGLW